MRWFHCNCDIAIRQLTFGYLGFSASKNKCKIGSKCLLCLNFQQFPHLLKLKLRKFDFRNFSIAIRWNFSVKREKIYRKVRDDYFFADVNSRYWCFELSNYTDHMKLYHAFAISEWIIRSSSKRNRVEFLFSYEYIISHSVQYISYAVLTNGVVFLPHLKRRQKGCRVNILLFSPFMRTLTMNLNAVFRPYWHISYTYGPFFSSRQSVKAWVTSHIT